MNVKSIHFGSQNWTLKSWLCRLLRHVSEIPEPRLIHFYNRDSYQPLRLNGKVNEMIRLKKLFYICVFPSPSDP